MIVLITGTVTARCGEILGEGRATVCSRTDSGFRADGEELTVFNLDGQIIGPVYAQIHQLSGGEWFINGVAL